MKERVRFYPICRSAFFESYPQLIEKIHGLREMPQQELRERYMQIDRRYGREIVTEKFVHIFDIQSSTEKIGEV